MRPRPEPSSDVAQVYYCKLHNPLSTDARSALQNICLLCPNIIDTENGDKDMPISPWFKNSPQGFLQLQVYFKWGILVNYFSHSLILRPL